MLSPEPPDARLGRRSWPVLLVAILVAALAGWYAVARFASSDAPGAAADGNSAAHTPAPDPGAEDPGAATPSSGNVEEEATERLSRGGDATPSSRARGADRPRTPASPAARTPPSAASPRELRVSADVQGAYVFLDRKFLGSTPLVSRDVSPGTHQLNVQADGRPPVVRTVEIAAEGATEVSVTLAPAPAAAVAALSAAVAVVHQHGAGSCEGTLRATAEGFRYDTSHKDAFTLPFVAVETFTVAYEDKRLRLKQRNGRTWNFTTREANADPLFVFHRDVDAARPR